ncbi:hypothetical protein BGZ65_002915, partial [Modicella reniformis]
MGELLQACAGSLGLKTLKFNRFHVPGSTIRALSTYHGHSLEELILTDSNGTSSSDLSLVVTNCPQLRCIEVRVKVNGSWLQDLLKSPWVCTDLRKLRLELIPTFQPLPPLPPPSVFDDLSTVNFFPSPSPSSSDNEELVELMQRQFWSQIGALKNLKILQLSIGLKGIPWSDMLSMVQEDIDHICGLE